MTARRAGIEVDLGDEEISIRLPRAVAGRLLVKGALQAEFGFGVSGPEDLAVELKKARASVAACSMMRAVLAELRRAEQTSDHRVKAGRRGEAFAIGFEAGLTGQSETIGAGEVASEHAPSHKLAGPSYFRGWELGRAIWAALAIAEGKEDPRRTR